MTQILHFKTNKGAYEFALVSLVNGFGPMNFFHVGIVQGKPFGKKKEIQKKIKGDVEKVVNEITKYKIKIAYKGQEVEATGTRTDKLSVAKRPAFKVGDLVAITDLSHSMKDKMTGIERDESKDYQFQILEIVLHDRRSSEIETAYDPRSPEKVSYHDPKYWIH